MAAESSTREALRDLVARVLERMEEEGPAALESACAERPDLAAALRQRIETLNRVGLVGSPKDGARAVPERLGEFRLIRRLGKGGMGVVYLAEQPSLKRRVALKLVRPDLLYFAGARDRFRREVEASARLHHPNIVPVHVVDDGGDVPYFAMEWVDGASLDQVLELVRGRPPRTLTGRDLAHALLAAAGANGGAPPSTPSGEELAATGFTERGWVEAALRVLAEAADAIDHAHREGVLHRDLKPSNLMLTREGRVRVVDFGLASTEGAARITRSGSQLGSLPYTSPEQLREGSDAATSRSDVYSLGVTLYELLTLSFAFTGANGEELRRNILEGRFTPPRKIAPHVTWDAETVCLTAMERDPARRYATPGELARDVRNLLEFRPIAARRASLLIRGRRFTQRRPALAVGAMLGTLLVIGGPALYAWQERRRRIDLGEANRALVGLNLKLEQANEDVAEQLRLTKLASRSARDAVTRFIGLVGDEVLRNVPRSEQLRKDLLRRAIELYRQIHETTGDDPDVLLEMAHNHRRLAQLETTLGEHAAAERDLQKAVELVEPIAAASPSEFEPRWLLALLERQLAVDLNLRERYADALPRFEKAVTLWRAIVAERPIPHDYRTNLASSVSGLAIAQANTGRNDAALANFREAAEQMAEIAAAAPDNLAACEVACSSRANLGRMLVRADQCDQAERVLDAALVDADRALERFGPTGQLRSTKVGALFGLSDVMRKTGQAEDALKCDLEAGEVLLGLIRDYPDAPGYAVQMGGCVVSLFDDAPDTEELTSWLPAADQRLERLAASAEAMPLVLSTAADVARAHGLWRLQRGERELGLACLHRAEATVRALLEDDPDHQEAKSIARMIASALAAER